MQKVILRPIEKVDNPVLATIIRNALEEFNANKPGTVYFEQSTDHLYELFNSGEGNYFVASVDEKVVGGAGIFPTSGLPADTCELVKIYLEPAARGKGLAGLLMQQCFKAALAAGFKRIYLETMPELTSAIPLYEKLGFTYLDAPLGRSGHDGCNIWMIKQLDK